MSRLPEKIIFPLTEALLEKYYENRDTLLKTALGTVFGVIFGAVIVGLICSMISMSPLKLIVIAIAVTAIGSSFMVASLKP